MGLIQSASFIPEKANLRYYIISIQWFNRWKAYTTSSSEEGAADLQHPGPINTVADIKDLLVRKDLFEHKHDYFYGNLHLKDTCKEDVHYKVVDEQTWLYLYQKYGGDSVPRLSIEVPADDGTDHIVEI